MTNPEGIAVVDAPEEPIRLMVWGGDLDPVYREISPRRALQLAADLVEAVLKRKD